MTGKTINRRTIVPVLIILVLATVSMTGYFKLRSMSGGTGSPTIISLTGIVYFISVAFGTLFVFSLAYIGGAALKERVLASFVVPFLWMSKEVLRLAESHPFAECLYWYINPLNVWLITLMILEMGIATLIARGVLKKSGRNIKVVTVGPMAVIIGSLIFVISVYAWGKGENVYVIFLSGYRLFFGSGV